MFLNQRTAVSCKQTIKKTSSCFNIKSREDLCDDKNVINCYHQHQIKLSVLMFFRVEHSFHQLCLIYLGAW